ncbi:tetratricopeptide repeat protein [Natronomonas halophila]|uniref:tetratricopeptide repeat protein n=1 Tax=Natronomonas halophila TaxID=2747817 RepID=UPI0015B4E343|nr:tetratricopeptide repeat protein [Natronomonas halophila]QLD86882.1 tetratricopeptide repeat protein [Natronomonas halophila]
MDRGGEVVSLALRRRNVLDALREPRTKRELVDELDVSRSTVDRAVRELETAGLVDWDEGSYRLTAVGSALRAAVDRLLAVGEGVAAIADALPALPPDIDPPAALLADGTLHTASAEDHRLPGPIRTYLGEAEAVQIVTPPATGPPVLSATRELGSGSVDVVLDTAAVDSLPERLPGITRWLAAADRASAFAGDTPPVAVLVVETDDAEAVLLVGEDVDGLVAVEATDPEAVAWGRELIATAIEGATPVLEDGHVEETAQPETRETLAREGIVELTPAYFAAREAAPLPTGWRAGLDLAEVAAGHAIERTVETEDGDRRPLSERLLDRLRDGSDVALVGPAGSGKSTACKAAACEWYQSEGPVFYRESGSGEPLESWPEFADRLQSVEGNALVVVEDAVRPEANAAFRLMQAFPNEDVRFLLDARESEWDDPASDDLPDDFRANVEVVSMPPLDEHDADRLVKRFEAAVDGVDTTASALLDAVETTDERPARLLCVLHRLSLLADPLGDGEPTSLDAAVRDVAETVRADGELTDDAALLVSLCTVAGIEVTADLVATLAPEDPEAVRETLSTLSGRILFPDPAGGFRTVHEAWASQYLRAAAERDGIDERVGECLSRLLAVADDAEARAAIVEAFDPAPTMERVEADPAAWAKTTVDRLFAAGLERPHLTPLFGESDPDPVSFPSALDAEAVVEVTEKRARMARYQGDLDRAEREYERLAERAESLLDDPAATRYAAERSNGLGSVARERSDFEAAADHYERAESLFRAAEDPHGIADARKNLGTVAFLRGDLDTAERQLTRSYERLQELGDEKLASYSLFNLAAIREERGDIEGAIERYQECLDKYRRMGRPADEADVHLNLGVALVVRGDIDAAADHYASALGIYRDIGEENGIANALQNHGEVALERGNLDEAVEYYERAEEAYADVGEEWGQVQCRVQLARIALERGNLDESETTASAALDQFDAIGDPRGRMEARAVLAGVAREREQFDRAESHLDAALRTGREDGYTHRTGRILAAYGDLERARDDLEAACQRYEAAAEVLEEAGARGELAGTLSKLADCREAIGDIEAAASHRERAAELTTTGTKADD